MVRGKVLQGCGLALVSIVTGEPLMSRDDTGKEATEKRKASECTVQPGRQ